MAETKAGLNLTKPKLYQASLGGYSKEILGTHILITCETEVSLYATKDVRKADGVKTINRLDLTPTNFTCGSKGS